MPSQNPLFLAAIPVATDIQTEQLKSVYTACREAGLTVPHVTELFIPLARIPDDHADSAQRALQQHTATIVDSLAGHLLGAEAIALNTSKANLIGVALGFNFNGQQGRHPLFQAIMRVARDNLYLKHQMLCALPSLVPAVEAAGATAEDLVVTALGNVDKIASPHKSRLWTFRLGLAAVTRDAQGHRTVEIQHPTVV